MRGEEPRGDGSEGGGGRKQLFDWRTPADLHGESFASEAEDPDYGRGDGFDGQLDRSVPSGDDSEAVRELLATDRGASTEHDYGFGSDLCDGPRTCRGVRHSAGVA